jgi:hypothetical protein
MSNVFDDFNRADSPGSLGTAPTGQTWANLGVADWGILSNAADAPNAGIAVIDSGFRNTIVQATILDVTAGGGLNSLNWGLVFSCSDNSNFYMISYSASNPHFMRLCSMIGGTFNGGYAPAHTYIPTNGDVISVVNCGEAVEVFINGVSLYSTSDINLGVLTGTKQGIQFGAGVVTPPQHCRWDDFSAVNNEVCGTVADWQLPSLIWTAEGEVESPSAVGDTATKRFDAGIGNSWWLLPQLSDSGVELRDKVIKAVRVTGKVTDAAFKVYGYGATEELDIASMIAGTNSRTGEVAIPDSTGVKSTQRYPVNVPGSALHTVRVEGTWDGENIKDRVDEIEYEIAEQGARR